MANSRKWACHCLNVQLDQLETQAPAPGPASPGFTWIYTTRDGVHVTHTQLTLRTRKYVPASGARQTLLTCLVCRRPVYGIWTPAENQEELEDGPVLDPSVDPRDPLMSSDGWIEVSTNDCLDEVGLDKAAHSSQWSPSFNLVLPRQPDTPVTGVSDAPPVSEPVYPQIPISEPLFLPAPYTPADPVFAHLSATAQAVSDDARRKAQAELDAFTRRKFEEALELDRRLRSEVDLLWATWNHAWKQDVQPALSPLQRRTNGPSLPGNSTYSQLPSLSHPRRPEPAVKIRDDFDSLPTTPALEEAGPSNSRSPIRSPRPGLPGSLISFSRLSSGLPLSAPQTSPPPKPTSERRPLPRPSASIDDHANGNALNGSSSLSSLGEPSTPTARFSIGDRRPRSLSKSATHDGRILVDLDAEESRAISASFKIMSADIMKPARMIRLANRGVSSTFDPEVVAEEEQEDEELAEGVAQVPLEPLPAPVSRIKTPSPPLDKPPVTSPKSPLSPKSAKRVTFIEVPEKLRTQSPSRNDEFPVVFDFDADEPDGEPVQKKPAPKPDHKVSNDKIDALSRRPRPRPHDSNSNSNGHLSERPGFVGSLPADSHLAKLATGPAPSVNSKSDEWKAAAEKRLLDAERAERQEALRERAAIARRVEETEERLQEQEDSESLDRPYTPSAPPVDGVPASLPVGFINPMVEREKRKAAEMNGPRPLSFIDRQFMGAGPSSRRVSSSSSQGVAQSAPGRGQHSGSRSRSASAARERERTYAVRDISQLRERDPGETLLSVPDEEEELEAEVEAAKHLAAVVVAENGGETIVEKGVADISRVIADPDVAVPGEDGLTRTNARAND